MNLNYVFQHPIYQEDLAAFIDDYSAEIHSDDIWVWRTVEVIKEHLPGIAREDLAQILEAVFVQMIHKGLRVEIPDTVCEGLPPYPPEVTRIIRLFDQQQPEAFVKAMVAYVLDHPDFGEDGNGFWIFGVPIEVHYDPESGSYRDLDLYIERRSNIVFSLRIASIPVLIAKVREDIPQMDEAIRREVLIRIIVKMAAKAEAIVDYAPVPHPDVAPILVGLKENPQQWAGPLLDFIEAHPDYGSDHPDFYRSNGIVFEGWARE